MRGRIGIAALLLSVLFWAPGIQADDGVGAARLQALASDLHDPASVTVPDAPIVVTNAAAANSRGWYGSGLAPAPEDLTDDVLAAYTLAVAVSPPECHLTTPVLAAIGQVESGNLAGRELDAGHRVSPAIMGPVLDGDPYRAVADTDGGAWDGNKNWDRALGPMQIIPATWRVVGVDMDGDGLRDPQNIYDAAGAAMVYLCAGGRDLSTAAGLREAVLAYNTSPAYLRAVLEWKSVFENADLSGTGAVPFVAALEMPAAASRLVAPSATTGAPTPTTTTAAESATPSALPTTAATSRAPERPTAAASPTPSTSTPAASTPPAPSEPDPIPSDAPDPSSPGTTDPTSPATGKPPADSTPTSTPDPTPLPECPVPPTDPTAAPTTDPATVEPTPPAGDAATDQSTPTEELVVSPETCTPPEGYMFDADTGELVPVPETTPAP